MGWLYWCIIVQIDHIDPSHITALPAFLFSLLVNLVHAIWPIRVPSHPLAHVHMTTSISSRHCPVEGLAGAASSPNPW